jgi:hypothetical protein
MRRANLLAIFWRQFSRRNPERSRLFNSAAQQSRQPSRQAAYGKGSIAPFLLKFAP